MKILYTASVLSHICQFHLPVMEALQKKGNIIHVAANNNLAEKNGLQLKFCDNYFEMPFQRSPRDKRNIEAYKQLKQLINSEKYDLIICNTPVVGLLTRLAARKSRKTGTKVIYIAHGFHFYTGAPKKYWAIYPIEKFFADYFTDVLITINQEDYDRAKSKFHCKIEHINGVGVRSERYHPASKEEQLSMRQREKLPADAFVILCTKELMFDNNQKTLLKATAALKGKIDNLVLLLAGNGPDEQILKQMVKDLNISEIVRFLGYRTDLEQVVPAMNLIVSCSYREGMPLNIIEAMLCARPIIASYNRGHNELIDDGKTGYLFEMMDDKKLASLILEVYNHPAEATNMGQNAYAKVQKYTSQAVVAQMEKIIDQIERR